jgi:DNA repair photolyase
VIRELSRRGVPTGVMAAPVIPALNDHELERILAAASDAGATSAGYVLLRLPHEVRPLFVEWLEAHYPERARHVLSVISQLRGGRLNDPRFHSRQRGGGPFAELLRARFERARRRHALDRDIDLDTSRFVRPPASGDQLEFF